MDVNMWHWINLRIKCKDVYNPEFHIALIILDLLLRPTIKEFENKFECWRYHWSATSDDGHRLKFFFKTTPEIAKEVSSHINLNQFCDFIKKDYLETLEIKQEIFGGKVDTYEIEAISEGIGDWPDEIRKSFPYFIRGACEMAIHFIEELKNNDPNKISKDSKKEEIEHYYKGLEREISEKWKRYGNHAFFHHLSMIIGNKPLSIGTTGIQGQILDSERKNILALLLVIDRQIFPSI